MSQLPYHESSLLRRVEQSLREIRSRCLEIEARFEQEIELVEPGHRPSARNLLHYLALRQRDLRRLQDELASLGLSSLGRLESHTLATIETVLFAVVRLQERDELTGDERQPPSDFRTGGLLLEDHCRALLGTSPRGPQYTRIMVTMPTEAASSPEFVQELVEAGMDIMRINAAHDGPKEWEAMVRHLRAAESKSGKQCRIYADLAGPKLRTGPITPVGRIQRVRPERDEHGRVRVPARFWLEDVGATEPPASGEPVLPLGQQASALLQVVQVGDELVFVDCRGRRRRARITIVRQGRCLAELERTAYIETGLACLLEREGAVLAESQFGELPELVRGIPLAPGEILYLHHADELGAPAIRDESGQILQTARIGCTLPEIFRQVRVGERIWFDDGKIGGVIRQVHEDGLEIEIRHAPGAGARLQAEKGINLPDSNLDLPALTEADAEALAFLGDHVDMVGLSFVREPHDILELEERLHAAGKGHLGIVLKIENRRAFENLPKLLLASLRSPPVGVMVARGDLAVEVGFERLAEVQEEILWLCEAAHVPVIWATQVLEALAKTGSPSRAEVSDVVLSQRAECVMLNKGPFIAEAVRFLRGVFERMGGHQSKKRSMLRRLRVSEI